VDSFTQVQVQRVLVFCTRVPLSIYTI